LKFHLDWSRLTRLAESPIGLLLPLDEHRRPDAMNKVTTDSVFEGGKINLTSDARCMGDAWANFGWLGVVFTSSCAGVYFRLADLDAIRFNRTDEWACINASCYFGVFTILSTAFSTALIARGLLIVPLLWALFVRSPNRQRPQPRMNQL